MWIHGNTYQLESERHGIILVAVKEVVVVLLRHHQSRADQTMYGIPSDLNIVHSFIESIDINERLNQYLV